MLLSTWDIVFFGLIYFCFIFIFFNLPYFACAFCLLVLFIPWLVALIHYIGCLVAVWSGAGSGCGYIFRLAELAVSWHWMKSWSRSVQILSARAGLCVAFNWITYIATSLHHALDHALEWSARTSVHTGGLSLRRYFRDLLRPCLR